MAMKDEDTLRRLNDEVLTAGRGASLPSSLSDEWLQRASDSLESLMDDDQQDAGDCVGLALVLKTLHDKDPERRTMEIPAATLYEYLQTYLIEVGLEIVSRNTEIIATPATLEMMFEPHRKVEVSRR
jgi:hypothetical protein